MSDNPPVSTGMPRLERIPRGAEKMPENMRGGCKKRGGVGEEREREKSNKRKDQREK